MKSALFAAGALLLAGTVSSSAADAWKTAEVGGQKVFTDANGMTLYTFDKDSADMSNCYDKCATNWPPLKAEGDAMSMGDWKVIDRKDGIKMWSYDGHPLYTFIKDKKAGDAMGEGVMGVWHVAKAE